MIVSFLYLSFYLFGLLLFMILFHELGHYGYFILILNKKIKFHFKKASIGFKIKVGTDKDYKGIPNKNLAGIYFSGIVAGLIPWFVSYFASGGSLLIFSMLLPYFWGAMPDFVNMLDVFKRSDKIERI